MKKLYLFLLSFMASLMLLVGMLSVVMPHSKDNGAGDKITPRPALSWAKVMDGSFMTEMEEHYADTFPFHSELLSANRALNQFYYFSVGENNYLIIDFNGGVEQGGSQTNPIDPVDPDDNPDPVTPSVDPVVPDEPDAKPPQIDEPDENEVVSTGNMIFVGNRAMDVPYAVNDAIVKYGQTISQIAEAMGDDIRVISLVTPNAAQFYTPKSLHTGSRDQKAMIEKCYANMSDKVITVDAYSPIAAHVDEYLYFRTDHHWTQLGAYYAYTGFCKALGYTAPAITDYESGTHENLVGSYYTWSKNYPQSKLLKDNPDTLTYYLPRYNTKTTCYQVSNLNYGYSMPIIDTNFPKNYLGKYICFLGGDFAITVVESEAEGGTIMVLKESYGNAFIPFLAEHYSKIIAIDPREFSGSGKPYLNIVQYAKENNVDDVLVMNYPFMINNNNYINMLKNILPQ